jgi:hypothetical protein
MHFVDLRLAFVLVILFLILILHDAMTYVP